MRGIFVGLIVVVVQSGWLGVAAAQDAETGSAGGACYGNNTCNSGLACQEGVCVEVADGDLGGACYGNGTCNAGLSCDTARSVCVAAPQPAADAPAPAAAPVATATGSKPPPPLASTGGRFSVSGGVAFPNGDFEDSGVNNSFYISFRGGKESLFDNFGLTVAGRGLFTYWFNDGDNITLVLIHLGVDGRAAYHFGNKVFYAAGGLGLDMSLHNVDGADSTFGPGMNVEVGFDYLPNPSSGFGGGFIIHPGFTNVLHVDGLTGIPDVTFFGIFLRYSTY